MYYLNIKGAFRKIYGFNFVGVKSTLGKYEIEDEKEVE